MKFRKKPVVIEAAQWLKHGDHPAVGIIGAAGDMICGACNHPTHAHGQIKTLESNFHVVCVGDWIITGVQGENYACKPDIFEATYELVEEPLH